MAKEFTSFLAHGAQLGTKIIAICTLSALSQVLNIIFQKKTREISFCIIIYPFAITKQNHYISNEQSNYSTNKYYIYGNNIGVKGGKSVDFSMVCEGEEWGYCKRKKKKRKKRITTQGKFSKKTC